MRIFDINNNELIDEYRLEGHLVEEKMFIKHHPAQEYREE
jgi:hypothetical protein